MAQTTKQEAHNPNENLFGFTYNTGSIQAWIAQLVVHWLGTREVRGSIPGKGDKFSMKISN